MRRNVPSIIDVIDKTHTISKFKNINGEGITSEIIIKETQQSLEVLCGNTKLMKRFEIFKKYQSLEKNVNYLEEEGKTVVILVIDNVPQLILALEETHLSKPES